jgi:hypothetical protein
MNMNMSLGIQSFFRIFWILFVYSVREERNEVWIVCAGQIVQRVLNDLQRTRLSFVHMIRLLTHPLPPSPVNKEPLFLSLPVCVANRAYGREKSKGKDEEPNHTSTRKPGPL